MRHTSLRWFPLVLLAIGVSHSTMAQTNNNKGEARIGVTVDDSFTNVGLPAFLTLMRGDSVVIDTATCKVYRGSSRAIFYIPKISGTYTMRAEYPGYFAGESKATFDFSDKKVMGWGFPPIKLRRKPQGIDSLQSINLDEIEVRATRLQVAYRGDTIVYDAAAFNIPEGAMLDALVRQLPGAEMKTNGDVYINGKKLDYITLNGNDFYKGNNRVILENLPYFVVRKLEVYYKERPFSLRPARSDEEKDYVLDVVMKREYDRGYIVNTEAGVGSDSRWKAKIFGMRYDDYSRISMYGNVNNVNEDRVPGSNGEWSPKKQPRGLLTTKQTGLDFTLDNAKKTLQLNQSANIEWSDGNTSYNQISQRFSSQANILDGKNSVATTDNIFFKSASKVDFYIGKFPHSFQNYITYSDANSRSIVADSTYQIPSVLVNAARINNQSRSRKFYGNGAANFTLVYYGIYGLDLSLNYQYQVPGNSTSIAERRLDYYLLGTNKLINNRSSSRTSSFNISALIANSFRVTSKLYANYSVGYEQGSNTNEFKYWSSPIQNEIDPTNSYDSYSFKKVLVNNFNISYSWKNTSVNVSSTYRLRNERLHFISAKIDSVAHRSYGDWNPNVSFNHRWGKNKFVIRYSGVSSRPDFYTLMPYTDTTDPLFIRYNNPNLRSQIQHHFSSELNMNSGGKKPVWWMKFEFQTLDHAWGTRVCYNSHTGAYSSTPDNIDGNWNTFISVGANGTIDEQRRWRYDLIAKGNYDYSVDYDLAYDNEHNTLNHVGTLRPEISAKLNYRHGNFSVGAIGKYNGNYSDVEEDRERNLNIHEYQYGVNSQYTFAWLKLTVGSDINLYAQNGYTVTQMNRSYWIWNAAVSRPFLKGKIVAKAEIFDILHQMSARSYRINAQSRVETYYNTIPSYVMFSLNYKFAKKPKTQK